MGILGKILLPALVLWLAANTGFAAITGLQRVASGLSAPIFATHAPGDTSRLFIAERGGAIRILDLNSGSLLATPFLTMTGIDFGGSEGGFLGLAFHPDYSNVGMPGYGKFYAKLTTAGSTLTVRIREFEVSESNSNVADPGSLREILNYTNPQGNHVGGWIGFSPNDNYLYIANGDGGGGNDTGTGHTAGTGNAQDITNNFLGKMLRIDPIDPDGPMQPLTYSIPPTNPFRDTVDDMGNPVVVVGDDEIWAYGLRNPFRDSFDRITGDLWIGDVGQGAREEIDFQAGNSAGGANYGWRLREGTIATPGSVGGPPPADNVEPVYDYNRDADQFGGSVVTGGYVYRGPDPSLQGQYFFLDSRNSPQTSDDNYWMFNPANPYGTVTNIDALLTPNTGSTLFPVSFGEDAVGNLYIAYIASGEVYRIATDQLIPGDYTADGFVNQDDYDRFLRTFGATGSNLPADGNKNGVVDAADYVVWRKFLGTSVHDGAGAGGDSVPEPATIGYLSVALVALGAAGLIRRSRRLSWM